MTLGQAADNSPPTAAGGGIDLSLRYPTQLTAGDSAPEHARPWEFTAADIFRLTNFHFECGKDLKVDMGAADLGIGHCPDGAVWAIVIPRDTGELTTQTTNRLRVAHVWLRFHPMKIAQLFPAETVFADGQTNLLLQMRRIANFKINASWHAGNNAMIPEPNDMTLDVDTADGQRRFFDVNIEAQTNQYFAAFEKWSLRPLPPITEDDAQLAFDQLWQSFDRKYAMFALRPEVDWAKMREEYRPRAMASKSTLEFAGVCADMLKPLRDLHIWLRVAGENVPVFNRVRVANANPSAHEAILGNLHKEGTAVQWAVTDDKIGFIAIYGWNDPDTPTQCQLALEQMRDTRGLIVDVRLNGGGSEDQAMEFAGRFLSQEFVYAYSQFRNGPNHTNLTEKIPRKVRPVGPWRYDRPVLLLIGQKCMSSNESFIGMMTGDPQATTMGDHTCGSSGNPEIISLPLDMIVSVPKWIDYLPDGTPLDEHGFVPQIPFTPTPESFTDQHDDLLTAALEHLRQAPLPEKPIAGPAFLSDADAEAQDESRPKVVSVFPAEGATNIEPATCLRVRFDRPMDPLAIKLDWKAGGFLDSDYPSYDAQNYEFSIPMRLPAGMTEEIRVNQPFGRSLRASRVNFPRDGFQSADHQLARLFDWKFTTKAPQAASEGPPPKILKMTPAAGSLVPYRTFLEIQFDQPMKAPPAAWPYLIKPLGFGEVAMVGQIQYDADQHTFHVPLLFKPKSQLEFSLAGFCSAAGTAAEPIKLKFHVSDQALSPGDEKQFAAESKNPQLLKALHSMQHKRAKLTSLMERVQTATLYRQKDLFVNLTTESASFAWQKPDRYFGDVTDCMLTCTAFKIGSDGHNWWWLSASAQETNLIVCPTRDMQRTYISLDDPFDLSETAPKTAAAGLALCDVVNGREGRYVIEHWDIDETTPEFITSGDLTRWWIDAKTGRPTEIRTFSGDFEWRERFLYDTVNQPLPTTHFAVPKTTGVVPTPPEALDKGYTNRFINLRDGSDGRMSLRWGKEGPQGRSSSGLN